jgi:hypothetical protein
LKNVGLASQLAPAALAVLLAMGCVNRGQHAPDGGTGGDTGIGGSAGHVGPVTDGSIDLRGAGGAGGAGPCVPLAADAAPAADAAICPATVNFENCATYNATLSGTMPQAAFKSFLVSPMAFCGSGSLEIDTKLMVVADASETGKGEVTIDVPGGQIDLGGKTITFHALAIPPTGNTTNIYVLPVSNTRGYGAFVRITANRTDWGTGSTSYAVGDPIVADVTRLSIQILSPVDYTGKIYIDEIDISPTPPDGGAGDTLDARPSDVREGGSTDAPAVDARDAPAG